MQEKRLEGEFQFSSHLWDTETNEPVPYSSGKAEWERIARALAEIEGLVGRQPIGALSISLIPHVAAARAIVRCLLDKT